MSDSKFCTNCRFMIGIEAKGHDPEHCSHPTALSLVNGQPSPCCLQRKPSAPCGPEALNFVGKIPDGMKKPLSNEEKITIMDLAVRAKQSFYSASISLAEVYREMVRAIDESDQEPESTEG